MRDALLERIVRHKSGCPKCERGEGHPVSVLTISYPGGRTRQFSLRGEQIAEVRRWLPKAEVVVGLAFPPKWCCVC